MTDPTPTLEKREERAQTAADHWLHVWPGVRGVYGPSAKVGLTRALADFAEAEIARALAARQPARVGVVRDVLEKIRNVAGRSAQPQAVWEVAERKVVYDLADSLLTQLATDQSPLAGADVEAVARELHAAWSDGVSSWEQDEQIQPAFYRQARAVLARLGGETK